ncbi:hypothetical protein Acr_11g0012940 [Actinidia rufa]|uniref:Uncharacterized protein n=1 Tax=Actinidia rufa TaxID=165716 RepID=A0A7J0FE90_9ERIC|nr:hypothetical protein Acr_11g0012940 [Actinidia rufa]
MENKGRDLSYNAYEMGGEERNLGHNAGEFTGQPQVMRNDMMNQPSRNSGQGTNYYQQMNRDEHANQVGHDTSFLQQTGEGVKHVAQGAVQGATSMAKGAAMGAANIAQGAATAVKNTLGMNTDTTTTATTTKHPSNPNPRI